MGIAKIDRRGGDDSEVGTMNKIQIGDIVRVKFNFNVRPTEISLIGVVTDILPGTTFQGGSFKMKSVGEQSGKVYSLNVCRWDGFHWAFVGIVKKFDQPTGAGKPQRILVQAQTMNDHRSGWFIAERVLKMNDGEKMLYRLEQ